MGNFQTVEKDLGQFDVITLIGVLEYAQYYISSKKPYEEFLKIVLKHLKPNGKLILAIENKLGMKYWAGCKEDHNGGYFESIENYPNNKGVRTFSRGELEKMFIDTGYSNHEFYYPYPDYKLPMAIYSDKFLPSLGDLRNNMRNFDGDRVILLMKERLLIILLRMDCSLNFLIHFWLLRTSRRKYCERGIIY